MTLPLARTALAILAALSPIARLQAAPAGAIQSYDTYKSWFVACDNTLRCVARGLAGEAQVSITRDAGPSGAIELEIGAAYRFALSSIQVDGRPATLDSRAWTVSTDGDATTAITHDLAAIRSLVGQLRNAARLSLGGGEPLPLDGLAAAVLRIDDRQGRPGGVTSLARPGPLPASRVPAALPVPRIASHPIRATLAPGEATRLIAAVRVRQKAVFAREDCATRLTTMDPETHALDRDRALVLIPCIQGAYQGSSLAFIAARKGAASQRLVLQAPYLGNDPDPDKGSVAWFTEAGFDPETGMLSMGAKGRGLADCGTSAGWIWNGARFALAELTLQRACGGGQPGDWPTLFRSTR